MQSEFIIEQITKHFRNNFIILLLCYLLIWVNPVPANAAYTFSSISDTHIETANFTRTINQIRSDNPDFILFNGDLENDGFLTAEIDPVINVLKNAGLYNNTFIVRGNHDDHLSNSSALWQNYFQTAARPLPSGVTNYTGINSTSTFLTYSFDYDNSRFIGLDSNQYGDPPTAGQYAFLEQRLNDAENLGLTHAFIFWHIPEYCVENTHCGCSTRTGCGPDSTFVSILNRHPIVSATFHGHEHVLGWVHMDNTRVPTLTRTYEEFLTSPSGNPYGSTIYPNRFDYYNTSTSSLSYGSVYVNGSSFTVSLYHVGSTAPVWTKTFTKTGAAAPTPSPIRTPTPLKSPTPTPTAGILSNSRPTKYYAVDRVRSTNDFALLAAKGINTAIVDFKVGPVPDPPANWDNLVNAAAAANIRVVIWPDGHQGSDVSGCRWETPFDDGSISYSTDYLVNIKAILDRLGNNPNVIGIVTAHEPVWVTKSVQDRCSENIADMTEIKNQIHNYIDITVKRNANYPPFKVWNYIDDIYLMSDWLADYSAANEKAQIAGIMDVAVIWQHCAGYPTYGGDGQPCESSNDSPASYSSDYYPPSARASINYDRYLIKKNGLEGTVETVFLIQTFDDGSAPGSESYGGKFTPAELQKYSCDFLNTGSLDGFSYYTWDEGWYNGNLKKYTDLIPVIPYVYGNCISTGLPTPTPIPKPGDADGNGIINLADMIKWLNGYVKNLTGLINGDFEGSGNINGKDYQIWLTNYGK